MKPAIDKTDTVRALKGNLFILIATIFFGVNIPVVKFLIPQWMSSFDVTIFRLCGGCVLFFNLSLRYANPIDVSIIMTLPPVFVIIINMLFRHARPSIGEIAGVIIAFAGAAAVIMAKHPDQKASDALLGNMLALASALCYAIYLVVLEGPTHRYRPISMLRWVFLAASLPALFLVGSLPDVAIFHAHTPAGPWLMLAFVVVCPTFLSYLLVNPAIKLIGSELVSIYQYLVPVVAAIASVCMHIATLHTIQIIAMAVIIGGMLLTNHAKKSPRKQPHGG